METSENNNDTPHLVISRVEGRKHTALLLKTGENTHRVLAWFTSDETIGLFKEALEWAEK